MSRLKKGHYICAFKHPKYDCAEDMSNGEFGGCENCFYCKGFVEEKTAEQLKENKNDLP